MNGTFLSVILFCFVIFSVTHIAFPEEDPYSILGVKRTASNIEIKRAYKKLARLW